MSDNGQFVNEAQKIVEAAQEAGVILRILGSTAFRIHCPEFVDVHAAMDRPMTDVDFVAYSKQDREIEAFFLKEGYELLRAALTPELFAFRRIFTHPQTGLHIDIFLDNLTFSHKIPFRNRLELDSPTIPLAELALEKLQITRLTEKDIKDMLILLAAHPVGDVDDETINGAYISALLAKDWGFYYTVTINLEKIQSGLGRYSDFFKPEDVKHVEERLGTLTKMIEGAPKSMRWKMRAAVGTKVKWYNEVDEVERADFLQDIH